MTADTATVTKTCLKCGFTAPVGDQWDTVEDATLGTLARCPECGSTNVQHRR